MNEERFVEILQAHGKRGPGWISIAGVLIPVVLAAAVLSAFVYIPRSDAAETHGKLAAHAHDERRIDSIERKQERTDDKLIEISEGVIRIGERLKIRNMRHSSDN